MGAFFLLIGCLIILGIQRAIETSKITVINHNFNETVVRNKYNDSLQFQYEFETRNRERIFEELSGMNKEIIANILSARFDKVDYDPDLLCAGFMKRTAENAIIAYRLKQAGHNLNPEKLDFQSKDVDLTIPADYITQGKLYLLSVQELEGLTGLNNNLLLRKFTQLNEEKMRFSPNECYKRIKGIMIRYYMESKGLQFFGMQDYLFLNITAYEIRRNEINDKFSLDDCKNWGAPLEFVG